MKNSLIVSIVLGIFVSGCSRLNSDDSKAAVLESKITELQAQIASLQKTKDTQGRYLLYPANEAIINWVFWSESASKPQNPPEVRPVLYRLDTWTGKVARLEQFEGYNAANKHRHSFEGWEQIPDDDPKAKFLGCDDQPLEMHSSRQPTQ